MTVIDRHLPKLLPPDYTTIDKLTRLDDPLVKKLLPAFSTDKTLTLICVNAFAFAVCPSLPAPFQRKA
jgi:hypothetical protein